MRGEVGLGVVPQLPRCLQIDEAENGDDDRGSQSCDRQAVQKRGEEQAGKRDPNCGVGAGCGGFSSGIEIDNRAGESRSEEHTSELQSLMRTSYADFCLKKKNKTSRGRHMHAIEQRV